MHVVHTRALLLATANLTQEELQNNVGAQFTYTFASTLIRTRCITQVFNYDLQNMGLRCAAAVANVCSTDHPTRCVS